MSTNDHSQVTVQAANAELEKVRSDWMKRPGVTALDVGYKYVAGQPTDQVAVRVHVQRKLPLDQIPGHDRFPTHLGTVAVDVIEASYGPQTPG